MKRHRLEYASDDEWEFSWDDNGALRAQLLQPEDNGNHSSFRTRLAGYEFPKGESSWYAQARVYT